MSETINDELDEVMDVLADVLGESKFSEVDRNDVIKELSATEGDDCNEFDYTGSYQYHPCKRNNQVVAHFVSMHKMRKLDEANDIDSEKSKNEVGELDNDMINAKRIAEDDEDRKTTLLTSLITVYPDVDPKLLNQICARLHNDATKIQEWLEANIDKIPEKRQVQAINRFALESTCRNQEKIWKCPNCKMWQIIGSKVEVAICSEDVSCGEFCIKCNKRAHSPFKCRQKCQRIDNMENEMSIFKQLTTAPDEDKGYAKIFIMRPQNNLDFSDPLHILYLAAEGTFLRMMEMANQSRSLYPNLPGLPPFPPQTSAMPSLMGQMPSSGANLTTGPSAQVTSSSLNYNHSTMSTIISLNDYTPTGGGTSANGLLSVATPSGMSTTLTSSSSNVSLNDGSTSMNGSAYMSPVNGSSHMNGLASASMSPLGGSSNMNSSESTSLSPLAGSTHMNGSASASMSPVAGSSNMNNSSLSTSVSPVAGSNNMNNSSLSTSMSPVAGSNNMNNSLLSTSMSPGTGSSHMSRSVSETMSAVAGSRFMNANGNRTTSDNGSTDEISSVDDSRSTNGSSSTSPMYNSLQQNTYTFTGGSPLHSLKAPPSTTQPSQGVPTTGISLQQLSLIFPSQRIASLRSQLSPLASTRLSGSSRRSRLSMNMSRNSIKAIKYIENESLRGQFNSCKSYFLSRGIPNGERLVFHGTSANLDSIIKDNLQLSHCKRFIHGKGIYFSEFPKTSQMYGKHLLLCRVMLGNPFEGADHIIPDQYQSKIVHPNSDGKANMIIIDNEEQILPAFIIELEDLEPPTNIF